MTTNSWSISAKPKNTRIDLTRAVPSSVDYVVEATHLGRTLTQAEVSGTITVTNPAASPRVATVTDAFAGLDCPVTDGGQRVIPAAGSVDFTFTCQPANDFQPSASDSNVASVSWSTDDGQQQVASPAEEISWDGIYLHNTVDIQDVDGDELSVLGSLSVGSDGSLVLLTPESGTVDGSTARFAYTAQLDATTGTCTPYDTTALVAGDDGVPVATDDASVQVCVATSAAPGLPHTGN